MITKGIFCACRAPPKLNMRVNQSRILVIKLYHKMNDQDLQVLQPKLHKLINYKSKGRQRQEKIARSLSGLFKELRNDRRVSNYGDYPIFRFILRECNLAVPHHRWSRAQMRRALAITEIPTEEGYKQVVIPPEFKVYMQNND